MRVAEKLHCTRILRGGVVRGTWGRKFTEPRPPDAVHRGELPVRPRVSQTRLAAPRVPDRDLLHLPGAAVGITE
jgi:hypothetical protein